jgi:hypothetical protein
MSLRKILDAVEYSVTTRVSNKKQSIVQEFLHSCIEVLLLVTMNSQWLRESNNVGQTYPRLISALSVLFKGTTAE